MELEFGSEEVVLSSLVILLATYTGVRHPKRIVQALKISTETLRTVVPMLVLAVFAGSFLGQLIPRSAVTSLIGSQSGIAGIFIASAIGAAIPGGPMITFPLVAAFALAGAGPPQLVALISGWAVIALHRLLALELPLMGRDFVVRRIAATVLLAPLSGVIAAAILRVLAE